MGQRLKQIDASAWVRSVVQRLHVNLYMGCVEVLQSMRALDFNTRTQVTRLVERRVHCCSFRIPELTESSVRGRGRRKKFSIWWWC